MLQRRMPVEYFNSVDINKPVDELYSDLDAYTHEVLEGEYGNYRGVEFWVVLPPLSYDGRFLKGICFSHGMDAIIQSYPAIREMFHTISDSLWCSYPWGQKSDAYFTLYENPERDAWFRSQHPDKADKILIPRQQADHVNERIFFPRPGIARDVDLFCLAGFEPQHNLTLVARSLKIYREKYPDRPIKLHLSTGKEMDLNLKCLTPSEMDMMREIQSILIHPSEYIHFVKGPLQYENQLPSYLSRSKLFLMTQLIGEKSYRINEAMCCNTPVICFEDFNKTARGDSPIFPEGAGMTSAFDAEALADTIHEALENLESFRPRLRYMEVSGRRKFLNACIDAFPYYADNLPDYEPGRNHENYWLDSGLQENYQKTLYDFYSLWDLWCMPFRAQGIENIVKALEQYSALYNAAGQQANATQETAGAAR